MIVKSYSEGMRKKRKQPKFKALNRGLVVKILGGLLGGGLLINNIEHMHSLEGAHQILDLSGLIVENLFDKTITIIELLIQLGKSE